MGVRGIINVAKMQIKLFDKEKEIKKLKETNEELRNEHETDNLFKYSIRKFLKAIMEYMYDIQTINDMNILEYDKKQRINSATKAVYMQCADFITKNELDKPEQQI